MQFMTHRLRVSNPMRRRRWTPPPPAPARRRGPTARTPLRPRGVRCGSGWLCTRRPPSMSSTRSPTPSSMMKVAAERQMAEIAEAHTPADITHWGARLLAHLDPDGTLSDDTDQKRRRRRVDRAATRRRHRHHLRHPQSSTECPTDDDGRRLGQTSDSTTPTTPPHPAWTRRHRRPRRPRARSRS